MGFFDLIKKKVVSSRVLVIHVGSTTVLGSLVVYDGDMPKIQTIISTEISVVTDLSYSQFEREMQKALITTISKLSGHNIGKIDDVYVFLSSPWYASQVRTAKLGRDIQFLVTKQMLDDMVSKEIDSFENEEVSAKHLTKDALKLIESKTVAVKLNGYSQENPVGKKATDLELSVFLAVAPNSLTEKITDSIHKFFSHNNPKFCTFLTASFLVTRDILPHKSTYVLLDIGGEITDVSIIRDGSPVQSISFPIGKNFILRRLARSLNRSLSESATLCMLYMEDKMDTSMKNVCEKILNESKGEWLGAFQKTLLSMTNEIALPDTILLAVDSEIAPWFVELTSREEFHQYSLSEKEFKVIQLNAELFHEKLIFSEGVPRNPFIMLEALGIKKL